MKLCHAFHTQKLQLYYGELSPDSARRLREHLEACSDCRHEWHLLQQDMKLLNERFRPDPGKAFWAGYWDTLAERMNRESQERLTEKKRFSRSFPAFPAVILRPAAAISLLVIGILIGRHLLPEPVSRNAAPAAAGSLISGNDARRRTVALLNQSKVMLLGFANFDVDDEDISSLDVPLQRQKSAAMLKQASSLRQQLDSSTDGRLERLLDDLEFILLQIANLEEKDGKAAVEVIRSSVDERSILFKITYQEIKETRRQAESGSPMKNTV